MRVVFFQAAMLATAATASEVDTPESPFIYDWLVQTSSIAEYFNESFEDTLAQISSQNKSEVEAKVDTEVDSDMMNQIEVNCEGNPDCIKEQLNGLTRIHVKDSKNTEVNMEMPANLKKKITFDSPTLTVEDAGFSPHSKAAPSNIKKHAPDS